MRSTSETARPPGMGVNIRSVLHQTWWEFRGALLSTRMLICVIIISFSVVAGSYGISLMALRPENTILPSDLGGSRAEFVLYLVSFMTAMFGSLMALILSFDAFSRDRESGAADVLVSRPITKRGIALSKFLGLNLAIAVCVISVIYASIAIIERTVGESIPWPTVAWYILSTVALFGAMTLVQMLLSLAARNAGSAIMYGVSVWFLYSIFWLVVSLSIAQWAGLDPASAATATDYTGSEEFSYISNRVDLFNPIGAFHLCTGILLAGGNEVITIPHAWAYAALLLWVVIPLVALMEIYNRMER